MAKNSAHNVMRNVGFQKQGCEVMSQNMGPTLFKASFLAHTCHAPIEKESLILTNLFREHRLEIFSEACVMSEDTVEEFRRDVSEAYAFVRRAEQKRHEGLAPLRWVSSLTDGAVQYDPNFPMSGDFRLPNKAEVKVSGIVALLRKMYLDKDKEAA